MGGSALTLTQTRRYSSEEYYSFAQDAVRAIKNVLPESRVEIIPSYFEKESFGDLDVLVELHDSTRDSLLPKLKDMGITEIVKNGPVWSLGWGNSVDTHDFQVDLVFKRTSIFEFALRFFSWNDCGNFLGRISRRIGFKLGFDGYWLEIYDGTYKFTEVLVSDDFDRVLQFMGFDESIHKRGFSSLNDIFDFVVASPYFDPSMFQLKNRNHDGRTRDSKRPNYIAFLDYIDQHTFDVFPIERSKILKKAFQFFDGFEERYSHAVNCHKNSKLVKSKFNGSIVSAITGLTGKPLGAFMKQLKSKHDNLDTFILKSNPDDISNWIRDFYKEGQQK